MKRVMLKEMLQASICTYVRMQNITSTATVTQVNEQIDHLQNEVTAVHVATWHIFYNGQRRLTVTDTYCTHATCMLSII